MKMSQGKSKTMPLNFFFFFMGGGGEAGVKEVYYGISTGAIIGNRDRKSRDPRRPMIWDNFSIFRTNCAILTSHIRADPRTCRGRSRGCYHVD